PPGLLRVIRCLPVTLKCGALRGQASDNPQGEGTVGRHGHNGVLTPSCRSPPLMRHGPPQTHRDIQCTASFASMRCRGAWRRRVAERLELRGARAYYPLKSGADLAIGVWSRKSRLPARAARRSASTTRVNGDSMPSNLAHRVYHQVIQFLLIAIYLFVVF